MGYEADGSLADLFKPESVESPARRITKRAGDFLHERVESHTPVARIPPGVSVGEWLRARGDRAPRHLRDSWRTGSVVVDPVTGDFAVDVYTLDPVAPHVEYPTRPHLIVPKDPDGWLRWWDRHGGIHFAKVVHHPGTQGSYMMHKSLAELEVEWEVIAAEEVDRWARSYFVP